MTVAAGSHHPDHIAELTRGITLPLAPINSAHLSVILETISVAWAELLNGGAPALTSGNEVEVNALLCPRLNHFCDTQPYWKDIIHSVHRGVESVSYDGSALENKPDLSLVFKYGSRNFPLAIECKIIDHPNSKSANLYCSKGVARFVQGDYAWAHREAIMLAYVRDGSTVMTKLVPQFAKAAKIAPDPFQTISHPAPQVALHPTVHHSSHHRSFSYLANASANAPPGPISLYHLWL